MTHQLAKLEPKATIFVMEIFTIMYRTVLEAPSGMGVADPESQNQQGRKSKK